MTKQPKKILFLGLGGAGQRHLRIFRSLLPDASMFAWRRSNKTPVLNPDFTVADGETLEERYRLEILPNLEAAYARSPDLVVISLPSSMQADAVIDAARRGVDVFVEKPSAIDLAESLAISEAVNQYGVNFFVSFQRRFHPLVQRMKSIIESGALGSMMSVRINVASYVPEWHPYEDFRDLYACRADLGGGVLRTECHELDLIGWLFGKPKKVQGILGCRGPYSLDVEDSADLVLDYGTFAVQVSLCFMQKNQARNLVFNGTEGWLKCDLNNQQLLVGHHDDEHIDHDETTMDINDMFTAQALYFLNVFERGSLDYVNAVNRLTTIINEVDGGVRE